MRGRRKRLAASRVALAQAPLPWRWDRKFGTGTLRITLQVTVAMLGTAMASPARSRSWHGVKRCSRNACASSPSRENFSCSKMTLSPPYQYKGEEVVKVGKDRDHGFQSAFWLKSQT